MALRSVLLVPWCFVCLLALGCGGDDLAAVSPTGPSPVSLDAAAGLTGAQGSSDSSSSVTGSSPDASGASGAFNLSDPDARSSGATGGSPSQAGPLRDFTVALDDRGRVRFDWRAPLDPSVTGYILFENYPRIILEHNLSSSEVCVGDVCSWTLGWQGNGTYRYSAAALNSRGDGRASHQRFTVNVALPSMVSGLAAVQQISGSSWNNVMVSWPPVQVNGVVDRAIMEYEVSGLGAPRTVMPDDCTGPSPRSCTTSFSGLSPGVHQFTVLTRNSAGVGPAAIATVDVQNPASGPLRAEWTGVPSFYTSLDPFTLQLEFSEPVDVSAAKLRDHVIRVTRGRVSSVRAGMGGDGSSWSVTVVPSQLSGDVLVEVVGRFPCSMRRAICGSGNRQLENSPYVYVSFAGGLTAEWKNVPRSYTYPNPVTVQLAFSQNVSLTAAALRDGALHVYNATVDSVVPVMAGRTDLWTIRVLPTDSQGYEPVVLEVWPDVPCTSPDAICTSDGSRLSNVATAVIE